MLPIVIPFSSSVPITDGLPFERLAHGSSSNRNHCRRRWIARGDYFWHSTSFREVRVVRLAKSARISCGWANQGIRQRGEIIELLNDDTIVTPGWAEAALAMFASSNVGAVAPLVLQGSPDDKYRIRVDSAGDDYDLGGFARKRGHRGPLTGELLTPCDVFGASASSASIVVRHFSKWGFSPRNSEPILRISIYPGG